MLYISFYLHAHIRLWNMNKWYILLRVSQHHLVLQCIILYPNPQQKTLEHIHKRDMLISYTLGFTLRLVSNNIMRGIMPNYSHYLRTRIMSSTSIDPQDVFHLHLISWKYPFVYGMHCLFVCYFVCVELKISFVEQQCKVVCHETKWRVYDITSLKFHNIVKRDRKLIREVNAIMTSLHWHAFRITITMTS